MKPLILFLALLCGAQLRAEEPVTWATVYRLEIAMCDGKKDEAVFLYQACADAYNMPHSGEYRANYVEIMTFVATKLLPEWEGRRQRALVDLAKWEGRAK